LREGAVIDYKNADLSPQDIVNILKGEKTDRTPVVLPKDEGQNVLLFWSGHGRNKASSGVDEMNWLDLPAGQGMTASLLSETLQQMADQKQFRQVLVCLEPCFSANMGAALEGITGVLAICSAGPYEQSFADSWSNELGVWMCDRFRPDDHRLRFLGHQYPQWEEEGDVHWLRDGRFDGNPLLYPLQATGRYGLDAGRVSA
jgi:glycosylphosphatidylinositol transamidase (GPIT) subunit GPI8